MVRARSGILVLLAFFFCNHCLAGDDRTQFPSILINSYIGLNLGYLNSPFSNLQLQPGFRAESIHAANGGIRLLLGHEFNKYFSGQIGYVKSFYQTQYRNINGVESHTVWNYAGTFTVKSTIPVRKKVSIYGEGGLSVISRRGFEIQDSTAIEDENYGTLLIGGGLQYQLNPNWDLVAGTTYISANHDVNQPYSLLFTAGFNYVMRSLSQETVAKNLQSPFLFPENTIFFGYTTNAAGYGVNEFFSKKPLPIFFAGRAQVDHGLWLRYQRNVFHTRKLFSLDWGTSFGYWVSNKDRASFYTMSVFPVFRVTFLRSKPMDVYFHYSLAGPSFISRVQIDGLDTGRHFTFQDFMGIGFYLGRNRSINAEIDINHYSNGNIFPENAAVKIPLTFSVGCTF